MNQFKKLSMAIVVSMLAMTGVQAATEINGQVLAETENGATPGDANVYWDISSSNPDYLDLASQAKTKNDNFIDFFVFDVIDPVTITFDLDATSHGVSFSQYGLFQYGPFGDEIDFVNFGVNASSFESSVSYTLTSGIYELDLYGTFAKQGGEFTGTITGVPVVPEPSSFALMLAGLGAMGAVARRRSKKTA